MTIWSQIKGIFIYSDPPFLCFLIPFWNHQNLTQQHKYPTNLRPPQTHSPPNVGSDDVLRLRIVYAPYCYDMIGRKSPETAAGGLGCQRVTAVWHVRGPKTQLPEVFPHTWPPYRTVNCITHVWLKWWRVTLLSAYSMWWVCFSLVTKAFTSHLAFVQIYECGHRTFEMHSLDPAVGH